MSAAKKVEEEKPPYAQWNTLYNTQCHAENLKEEDPQLSDEEAFERASQDHDHSQFEWECFLDDVQTKLDEYNPDGRTWLIRGEQLGWQNRSGEMTVDESSSTKIFQKLLPNTEVTLEVFADDDQETISIRCCHHDSPTGEWYYFEVSEGE